MKPVTMAQFVRVFLSPSRLEREQDFVSDAKTGLSLRAFTGRHHNARCVQGRADMLVMLSLVLKRSTLDIRVATIAIVRRRRGLGSRRWVVILGGLSQVHHWGSPVRPSLEGN
jgi:hypothetical protein